MVRVGANDVHAALAADDLAIFATATDGWMNLHSVSFNLFLYVVLIRAGGLGVAIDDASTMEVIGRHLNRNRIARQDTNVIHADLARNVRQDLVSIRQQHFEARIGKAFLHLCFQTDIFFLSHESEPLPTLFRSIVTFTDATEAAVLMSEEEGPDFLHNVERNTNDDQ